MAARKGSSKGSSGRAKARPKRQIAVRAAPDGSELCLQCGLCCDGTLFGHIKVEEVEREFVESLGLQVGVEIVPDGEILGAPEPCPAFKDGCCSLYHVGRPQTCGSYQCGLLDEYLAGGRQLDEALAVVRLVWSLSRQLEGEMNLPLGAYNRRALKRYLDEHQPWRTPVKDARFLVAFHRLRLLGERYFGYESRPAEVEAAEAGAKVAAEEAESPVGTAAG